MRAIIKGIEHWVPEERLTNKDLEKMVDTNDEWIRTRTGISERRILDKEKGTSFMAVKAAEKVLAQTQTSPDEVDLIIVATVTPDMFFPSTAALVQDQLKANHCWGFDLSAGCSGFVYGLATGAQFIESRRHKKVLVIGADKMSSIINYADRNTCVLFGDGAGAVLLEPSPDDELGMEDFFMFMDGSGGEALNMPAGGSLLPATYETVEKNLHFLYQDGKTVFKHAVTRFAQVSEKVLEANGLTNKDVKLLIPHQANTRIIDSVAKKLKLSAEQVVINIERYGNTTAATIPIALSEAHKQNRIQKGDWILMSAFGAGYTAGSILLKWAL